MSCASIELQFCNVKDELNANVESDENYTNEQLEKLDKLEKHISICHQSTQSMSPTFFSIRVFFRGH